MRNSGHDHRDSIAHRLVAWVCAVTVCVAGGAVTASPVTATTMGLTTVEFRYTGATSQSWTIPAGVQTVYVTLVGGAGGGSMYGEQNLPSELSGMLTIPDGATALEINVGGDGQWSANWATSTSGGWGNGFAGAAGGTASGGVSWAGGAGGGATDIRLPGALPTQALMVAGGAGGSGGDAAGASYLGGAGGAGGLEPGAGAAGQGSGGDGGSGGVTGTVPSTPAVAGGNASNDNNGGGGGGGGGWVGGSGGQAGQADAVSFNRGAGGGGSGGSSYADPTYVTGVNEGSGGSARVSITYLPASPVAPQSDHVGEWIKVPVATTSATGVKYELVAGQLPPGMTLDGEEGTLAGAPSEVGAFTFSIAVKGYLDTSNPITTIVTDQWTVTPGAGAWLMAGSATGISASSATLNGFIKGGGEQVTAIGCRYTTDINWITGIVTAPATPSSVPGNLERTTLTCPISGLTGNTLYYWEFYGTQAGTQIYSNIQAFTSSSAPAVVTTGPATNVTRSSAVGTGTITANQNVSAIFCRIATTLPGVPSATPIAATPASTTGIVNGTAITCPFTGLAADTLYYYGVFATDASGTSTSASWTEFVTDQAPPRLALIQAGSVTATSAEVTGRVWATNENVTSLYCRVIREPGNPDMGQAVAATPFTASGSARDLPVACDLTGLASSTTYRARMYAVDPDGTSSSGNTVTFTTGSSGGGGGGGSPAAPSPSPTQEPLPATTTEPAPPATPVPTAVPTPILVVPGLVRVPPGSDIPVRTVALKRAPSRSVADAPTASARRDIAFALRVRDLPSGRTMHVGVTRDQAPPFNWKPAGSTEVDQQGRSTLPALLSTRKGKLTLRLTLRSLVRYVVVDIKP